jgi:hypothetical protein
MEGHDFVHAKHETLHFLLLSIYQGILIDIVGHNPFLIMGATKKGGSLLDQKLSTNAISQTKH